MQEVKSSLGLKARPAFSFSVIYCCAGLNPALCADFDSASRCTTPTGMSSTTNTRLTPGNSACCRGKEDEQSDIRAGRNYKPRLCMSE